MRDAVGNATACVSVPHPNFIYFLLFFSGYVPIWVKSYHIGRNRPIQAEIGFELGRNSSKNIKKKVQNALFELEALNKKP